MPWAPFRFTTHMPFSCRFYMFLLLFSAAKESHVPKKSLYLRTANIDISITTTSTSIFFVNIRHCS